MDIRTKDNDFVFYNGDLQIIDGFNEVAQRVKERLQSYAFEFFLNDEGLPYFEEMTGKGVDANRVESLIISVINGTYGVRSIESLNFTYDTINRHTSITAQIQTIFDQGIEVQAILPTISDQIISRQNILLDLLAGNIRDRKGENLFDLTQ